MITKTILFSAILLIGSYSGYAQTDTDSAIKAVIEQMTTAQTAYDATALDRIFTADYIEISPVGEFDPREKVLTFYSPNEKARNAAVKVDIAKNYRSIRTYGSTAVAIVELTYSMNAGGRSLPPRKMMATVVGRKQRGKWKIASVQYTGMRPANPPAEDAR